MRGKITWKRVLLTLAILLVIAGGVIYWQAQSLLNDFSSGYKAPIVASVKPELGVEPRDPARDSKLDHATTFLLVGSDIRPGEDDYGRSDTVILARVDPDQGTVSLLSLPRDLLVPIPGYGSNKLNAAYSYGGPALLIKTLREWLGVKIDHYFQVDFDGFGAIVDELGGVYLPIDQRYYHSNAGLSGLATYSEIDLKPGYQHLNAYDALAWVRYRHGDTDFLRAARQQIFLREVGRQADQQRSSLSSVKELLKVVSKEAISDLDNVPEALKLANTLRGISSDKINRVTIEATSAIIGGEYDLIASEQQKAEALKRWSDPESVTSTQQERPSASEWGRGSTQLFDLASALAPRSGLLQVPLREARSEWVERLEENRSRKLSDDKVREKQEQAGLVSNPADALLSGSNASCSPQELPPDYYWPDEARNDYELEDQPATALYATRSSGYSVLWMWADWDDPPILDSPTDQVTIDGENYQLYWESGALRQIAWRQKHEWVWITNTLSNELTPDQMIALAKSCV